MKVGELLGGGLVELRDHVLAAAQAAARPDTRYVAAFVLPGKARVRCVTSSEAMARKVGGERALRAGVEASELAVVVGLLWDVKRRRVLVEVRNPVLALLSRKARA